MQSQYNAMVDAGYYKNERMIGDVQKVAKEIALLKQKRALDKGEIKCPFETSDDSFKLQSQEGVVLCDLTMEQMHGEFAWFFDHQCLYKNNTNAPIVTTELEGLAELAGLTGEMEHIIYE